MEGKWTPVISTAENRNQENRLIEGVDSRWHGATSSPLVREMNGDEKIAGVQTGGEQGYTNGTRGAFNLGAERTRQRNALNNAIYEQVLSANLETGKKVSGRETGLNQMLRAIDQLPGIPIEGRVYVCEDGEMGIVWEDGERRVELSAGVALNLEYLIWQGNDIKEREWDVGGGQPLPDELRAALAWR